MQLTNNPVIHPHTTTTNNTPADLQEGVLALNLTDRLGYIKNSQGQVVKVFDQFSESEADNRYLHNGIIPVSRVGDTPYLPLDVKGDFKGSVVPTSASYVLREVDGSVVGIRPGYNGVDYGMFYFYSPSGRVTLDADFVYTDTPYAPNFLRNDGSVSEYIANIQCCNQHGFLAKVYSRYDRSYMRWYWIHTNETLDPLFHTYVDVTDTIMLGGYELLSLQYIKEANSFWGTTGTAIKIMFFQNNLPSSAVNVPSPASTTLLPKSINCINPTTGVPAPGTSFLNYDSTNYGLIYKPLSPPGFVLNTVLFPVMMPSISNPNITRPGNSYHVVYQPMDDGITLSMYVAYSVYNIYNNDGYYTTVIIRLRYDTQTNTCAWYTQPDGPEDQVAPFIFSPTAQIGGGAPGTDEYKQNKYPLLSSAKNADDSIWHAYSTDAYNFIDNHTVLAASYSYSFVQFSIANIDVSSSTNSNKLTEYTNRPYLSSTYQHQVRTSRLIMYPYDASLIGKQLSFGSFYASTKIACLTATRQFGQPGLGYNVVSIALPNADVTRTLDGAPSPNALSLPSSVKLLAADPVLATVPELYQPYGLFNSAVYENGDFRVQPYTSTRVNGVPATSINSQVIKVIDGDTGTYDAGRGGSSGVAIFPVDIESRALGLIAYFKSLSALGFGSATTADTWSIHYVSTYNNSGQLYAICIFQYIIQNSIHGNEKGLVTLRIPLSGIQMVVSPAVNGDIVSVEKLASNIALPTAISSIGAQNTIGVFHYTDGRKFVHVRTPTQVVQGNAFVYYSSFELSYDGTLGTKRMWYGEDSASFGNCASVHPSFGPLIMSSQVDYSQARVKLTYWPNGTSGTVAKVYNAFQSAISASTATDIFALTVESAEGFNVYVTQFACFLKGRMYQVPTMTVDLTQVVPDPASKVFYVYIHAISDTVINMEVQTSTLPETWDRMFIGTVTTNTVGVSLVELQKTTRLDLYRPNHSPYVGMAMPIPV